MKSIKKLMSLMAIVAFISFTSCSDDENNVEEPQKELTTVLDDFQGKIENINMPTALKDNSNMYAQQAEITFNTLKGYGNVFSAYFAVPENAVSQKGTTAGRNSARGTSETYTWTDGTNTINYTISESSDRYAFTYQITSPSYSGTLMSGYYLKDDSYAEFSIFDENGAVLMTSKWWMTATSLKMEIATTDGSKLVMQANQDNSGNIKAYESGSLTAEYNWSANGSGWYKNYESGETFTW